MLKRLISGALTLGILGTSAILPASTEAAKQSITAEIFPDNYIIRYGGKYSHTAREIIAVNTMPANIRTDQDDMYSRYVIPAPEAVTNVAVNIPKLGLMMKDENTEAIMGMSLRYSFDETELPKDGVYYTTGKYDNTLGQFNPETEVPDGKTAEECEGVLNSWRDKLFYNRAEAQILINQIKPSTFGITDGTKVTKNIAMSGYYWAREASSLAAKRYPDLAGYIFGGWSQLDAARVNDSDEYLTVKDKDGNQTCGVNFYVVDLDPAKRVKSYKFENANAEKMYRYNLFAVTEKALSNNELKEKIAAADLNDEKDMVDAVIFADELRARNAVSSGEYTTLYAAYDAFLEKSGIDKKDAKSFYVKKVTNRDEDGYEVGELKSVKTQGNTLSNLAYKLNNKEAVKIAYVGGSLTYGSGDEANCWRKQNMAWFEENYPESEFTFKNCQYRRYGSKL